MVAWKRETSLKYKNSGVAKTRNGTSSQASLGFQLNTLKHAQYRQLRELASTGFEIDFIDWRVRKKSPLKFAKLQTSDFTSELVAVLNLFSGSTVFSSIIQNHRFYFLILYIFMWRSWDYYNLCQDVAAQGVDRRLFQDAEASISTYYRMRSSSLQMP